MPSTAARPPSPPERAACLRPIDFNQYAHDGTFPFRARTLLRGLGSRCSARASGPDGPWVHTPPPCLNLTPSDGASSHPPRRRSAPPCPSTALRLLSHGAPCPAWVGLAGRNRARGERPSPDRPDDKLSARLKLSRASLSCHTTCTLLSFTRHRHTRTGWWRRLPPRHRCQPSPPPSASWRFTAHRLLSNGASGICPCSFSARINNRYSSNRACPSSGITRAPFAKR